MNYSYQFIKLLLLSQKLSLKVYVTIITITPNSPVATSSIRCYGLLLYKHKSLKILNANNPHSQ